MAQRSLRSTACGPALLDPQRLAAHPRQQRVAQRLPFGIGFASAINDVRDVVVRFDDLQGSAAAIAGISTQVLAAPGGWGQSFTTEE